MNGGRAISVGISTSKGEPPFGYNKSRDCYKTLLHSAVNIQIFQYGNNAVRHMYPSRDMLWWKGDSPIDLDETDTGAISRPNKTLNDFDFDPGSDSVSHFPRAGWSMRVGFLLPTIPTYGTPPKLLYTIDEFSSWCLPLRASRWGTSQNPELDSLPLG